jgi:chromosome segregation ATPase
MTPDQFFDQLDEIFGCDDGYVNHLERIKGLKEENKKLKAQNEYLWEPVNADDYIRLQKQYDELREQLNEESQQRLKNKECWMAVQKQYHEIKEENEKLKKDQLKEIKIMKNKCLKSVSKLSKKIKELQEQIDNLETDICPDDNEQPVIPEAKADSIRDEYEKLSSGEYWNKSNNRIYDRPGRNIEGAMVFKNDRWVKYYC